MSYSLNQEFLDETIADAKAVKAELQRRGWTERQIIDLAFDDPVWSLQNGAVCMTGAVGVVLEATDFLDFVWQDPECDPYRWSWSPRALRLIDALLDAADRDDSGGQHPVSAVVELNDAMSLQREAEAWLDRTIAMLEERRVELDWKVPVRVERDTFRMSKQMTVAAPQMQPETA